MTRAAVPKTAIERAIKALEARGLAITGVEISPAGDVRVLTGPQRSASLTPLEAWREAHRRGEGIGKGRAA